MRKHGSKVTSRKAKSTGERKSIVNMTREAPLTTSSHERCAGAASRKPFATHKKGNKLTCETRLAPSPPHVRYARAASRKPSATHKQKGKPTNPSVPPHVLCTPARACVRAMRQRSNLLCGDNHAIIFLVSIKAGVWGPTSRAAAGHLPGWFSRLLLPRR